MKMKGLCGGVNGEEVVPNCGDFGVWEKAGEEKIGNKN
jgi:hypothetical protein